MSAQGLGCETNTTGQIAVTGDTGRSENHKILYKILCVCQEEVSEAQAGK